MGREAECRGWVDGRRMDGKALLETDHLLFRSDVRVKVPISAISAIEAGDGRLSISHAGGTLELDLGDQAERWYQRITSPPSLMKKLGIKPEQLVVALGELPAGLASQIAEAGASLVPRMRKSAAHVLLVAEDARALARFSSVAASMARDAGVWVIYPKGRKDITEDMVLQAGRATGLKDVKVASVSATHTGLRFVIPVAQR